MRWRLPSNGLDRTSLTRGAILLLVFGLVGILLIRQVNRFRGKPVELWVASANLAPGTVVQAGQLTKKTVREPSLPNNVVLDRGIIEGRQLAKAKAAGSPFFRTDFAPPDRGPGLAGILPEGRVLVLVRLRGSPIDQLAEQLRFGDRLDIVASGGAWTALVAQDTFFLGWIAPQPAANDAGEGGGLIGSLTAAAERSQAPQEGAASPLLLGVHPSDAVPLAEAQAAGLTLAPVLHGKNEVEKGKKLVLTRPRFDEIELITGAKRERIPLSRLQLQ
ncbi:MAG TPA: SAF domain-containing protein [Thermoanaerobaculia bacterium]